MPEYVLGFEYAGGKGFRGFLNEHILFDTPGFAATIRRSVITAFLKQGDNSITVQAGSMTSSAELTGTKLPDMHVLLRKIHYFGDNGTILEQYEIARNDDGGDIEKVDDRETLQWTFSNPCDMDFDRRLSQCTQCNPDEDTFLTYRASMVEFAQRLREQFLADNMEHIKKVSSIRLTDDGPRMNGDIPRIEQEYVEALKEIKKIGMGYDLQDERQLVFLPTCGGKLWYMGVMDDPAKGQAMQEAVAMLPAALPNVDYDFFQSRLSEGSGARLPCYLAFIGGACSIVR